eukprot:UN06091
MPLLDLLKSLHIFCPCLLTNIRFLEMNFHPMHIEPPPNIDSCQNGLEMVHYSRNKSLYCWSGNYPDI